LGDVAGEMAKSQEYQNAKCEYGSDHDTEYFTVAVPRLARVYINDLEGIRHGEMRFRRQVMCEFGKEDTNSRTEMI
jgi:hypothetical protein